MAVAIGIAAVVFVLLLVTVVTAATTVDPLFSFNRSPLAFRMTIVEFDKSVVIVASVGFALKYDMVLAALLPFQYSIGIIT